MKMEKLPPIPTPLSERWRSFRMNGVPPLVVLAVLGSVVMLWRSFVGAPTLVGEAEPRRALVTSPQTGVLLEIRVTRFEVVESNAPLAVVLPTDARSELALMQAELGMLRTRMDPNLSLQRNAVDYERLRLQWLVQKTQLASDRVSLELAESDFRRDETLFKSQLLPEAAFEAARSKRDLYRSQVEEKSRLVTEIEANLSRLQSSEPSLTNAVVQALVGVERRLQAVESRMKPIILRAPMAGMVSAVCRQPGENVREGDLIATIGAAEAERIVGYLRQPLPLEPQVGMPVEIRSRTYQRAVGLSSITRVGVQFEVVTNSLMILRSDNLQDLGLPIEVAIPKGLSLRPGERVDLFLRSSEYSLAAANSSQH